jgi:CheY-like chemotaxis protein
VLARVLLVDDNEADIELNRIILIENAKLRCDLLTAYDGREALIRMQEAAQDNNPIDLILLDINMPGMSGFELLAQMQKHPMPHEPLVIMCTTSAYDLDRRMAESFKMAGYLLKPLKFALLKEIIDYSSSLNLYQDEDHYILRRAS